MTKKKILITGGTGFIGGHLRDQLQNSSWDVQNLGRSERSPYQWTLNTRPGPETFEEVEVLIHCAYDLALARWDDIQKINIEGTEKLFEVAAAAGIKKFVLISSIAAFDNCQSDYGRAKLACENIAQRYNSIILRPGMVYGEESGGVYGAMENWVKSLPVTPVLVPSPDLYMCHIQDLCGLIKEIVSQESWSADTIPAGQSTPMSFKQVIRALQRRHGSKKPVVPIPWRFPWMACKALEVAGLRPPFRSDGLVGLMRSNPAIDFSSLNKYHTQFRDFADA